MLGIKFSLNFLLGDEKICPINFLFVKKLMVSINIWGWGRYSLLSLISKSNQQKWILHGKDIIKMFHHLIGLFSNNNILYSYIFFHTNFTNLKIWRAQIPQTNVELYGGSGGARERGIQCNHARVAGYFERLRHRHPGEDLELKGIQGI